MDMILFDDEIPVNIKEDVSKHVYDWCSRGGSETDDYVKRQYEYLLRVKESIK